MGSSGRLITSADILDGTISFADLAANAVTKVHASQQLNGAVINVVGPTTLWDATVTSSGGYFLALVAAACLNNTAAIPTTLHIKVDAAAAVPVGQFTSPAANYVAPLSAIYPVGVIAVGSGHHVILQWGCTAGTQTTCLYGYYTVVELIR